LLLKYYSRVVCITEQKLVPWLGLSFFGIYRCVDAFRRSPVHVRGVVHKVSVEQIFLRVFRFYPTNILPPVKQHYDGIFDKHFGFRLSASFHK